MRFYTEHDPPHPWVFDGIDYDQYIQSELAYKQYEEHRRSWLIERLDYTPIALGISLLNSKMMECNPKRNVIYKSTVLKSFLRERDFAEIPQETQVPLEYPHHCDPKIRWQYEKGHFRVVLFYSHKYNFIERKHAIQAALIYNTTNRIQLHSIEGTYDFLDYIFSHEDDIAKFVLRAQLYNRTEQAQQAIDSHGGTNVDR